ncbi:hypothetical protein [Botrimarina hoheduenensis]|uniref:Uncharacterized protein n=1 Tax=Botrimarina hoheduenensis TaxID=2528000 RepID=A0A5C5W992_9BACT|nr:hypothetical protein [Botrimarina hoheduenensis]TWT47448.1 hypothetical protein Pla111_10620 [Botrimarina hoheduenensis]
MAWVFERTVEAAAWVALVVAWSSLGLALYWMYQWFGTLQTGADFQLLRDATKAAGAFVGFALALGGLACVDRFLFDADHEPRQPG